MQYTTALKIVMALIVVTNYRKIHRAAGIPIYLYDEYTEEYTRV